MHPYSIHFLEVRDMAGKFYSRGVYAIGLGLAVAGFAACQTSRNGASGLRDASTGASAMDATALAAAAQTALNKECGACHGTQANPAQGGINYITDLQKLIDKKKVKRGAADVQQTSRVLVRMYDTENPMPPLMDDANNPIPRMTDENTKAIQAWVAADSPIPAVVPPVTPPATGGGDATTPATLANAARTVFEKQCASCHNAAAAQGGIAYITDLQKLVDKKKVKRGSADDQKASRVLVRMLDVDDPMPPLTDDANNPIARVSQPEIDAVQAWIVADSPIPATADAGTTTTVTPP